MSDAEIKQTIRETLREMGDKATTVPDGMVEHLLQSTRQAESASGMTFTPELVKTAVLVYGIMGPAA